MCETNAYLIRDGKEDLIMEDVASVRPTDGKLELKDIFGAEKTVSGNIKEIRFLDGRILIE